MDNPLVSTILQVVILIVIIIFIMWPISIPLLIYYLIKKKKNKKEFKNTIIYSSKSKDPSKVIDRNKDIDEAKLSTIGVTDLSNLKKHLYNIFYKFENAYNSLDYNTMYNLCTQKLYEVYHSDISVNLKFQEKKIIEQLELKKMFVYDVFTASKKHIIYTTIEISNISYNQKANGKIISGNPTKPINEKFEVIFIKTFQENNNYRCPNCGANVSGNTCDYCKSKLSISGEYRIDSINKIVD